MTYFHISRDFSGQQLDRNLGIELDAKIGGPTIADVYTGRSDETLRPADYPVLSSRQIFRQHWSGGDLQTQFSRSLSLGASIYWQGKINYDAPAGIAPFFTHEDF